MKPIYSGPEALEKRIAPAGLVTVTFSHGVLELKGDAGANRIDAIETSRALHITDLGEGDTQFKYRGELLDLVTIDLPIRKLKVLAESGLAKTLSLQGLKTSRAARIAVSDGSDVTLDSVQIGGGLAIGTSTHIGTVRLTGDVVKVGGVMTLQNVESVIADPRVLTVGTVISLVDSPDVSLIPQQKLKVVDHGIAFSHHSKMAGLTVSTDRLRIAGNMRFFYNETVSSNLDLTVEARLDGSVGGINVASDSHRFGRPDLTSLSLRFAGNLSLGDLTAFGTSGVNSIELSGAIDVSGDLRLGFGGSSAALDTHSLQSLRVGGVTEFLANGIGNALKLTALQSLDFGGSFRADFRGGDFSFLMTAPTIETHDHVRIRGGADSITATIRAQELVMTERLSFKNSNGSLPQENELRVEASKLTLAGGFRYRGMAGADITAGSDRVFIETGNLVSAGTVEVSAVQNTAELQFAATRGTSVDKLTFSHPSGESVVGLGLNLTDLGPAILRLGTGDATVSIDNAGGADRARYTGRLRISGDGDTDIEISNAEMASVRITTGDGSDRISIEGSKFLGPFVATSESGADSFLVETEGRLGNTAFRGIVLVHLGDGDDTLQLGNDTPRSVLKFVEQSFFEGGTGVDTVASMSSAIKGIAPVIAGFEVVP